jgi:hypothetical protein
MTLRPRPVDHDGFPEPEDPGGDVKNLIGGPGTVYVAPDKTLKVANNDSIWLDLDFPVMRAPDGRKYKPLFAPLIIDLDNRINVNVHGNLRGQDNAHASNQGWGPWEVSLARVLNSNSTEWKNLFTGSQIAGRYGRDADGVYRPHGTASLDWQAKDYAPADFDGSDETNNRKPSGQLLPPTGPYCFPARPNGYGNGLGTEWNTHPNLYNPLRPMLPDRAFTLSNMEALLRYGDTGTHALASELFQLCPTNFLDPANPGAAAVRRRLVTTHSFDVSQPGLFPWLLNPQDNKHYHWIMSGPHQQRFPVGRAQMFPDLPRRLTDTAPGSEQST